MRQRHSSLEYRFNQWREVFFLRPSGSETRLPFQADTAPRPGRIFAIFIVRCLMRLIVVFNLQI